MINLNLNVIGGGDLFGSGSARSRGSNFLALWNWDFDERTVGIDAPNMDAIAHASFSLNAQNSNAIGISNDDGSQFLSIEDLPVTASISGSGQWPVTGSCTMSLYISAPGGDADTLPFFFTGAVSCSAAEGNISTTSGSIISCETTSSKNFIYFVSASIIHHKGNEFNPLVKVLATGSIPTPYASNTGSLTTLNIIKDRNVPISMSIGNITGSQSSSFQYDYAFNVTASLTGSDTWPRSASFVYPTSSLIIPELGINRVSYVTSSILTASFAANTNTQYTITASINARYIPNFSASLIVIGGGGGGAAGGQSIGPGGGGGAGGYQYVNVLIQPNVNYTVDIVGTSGSAGINTPGASEGGNGTLSKLTYWNGPDIANGTSSLIASGGLGADTNGNGGASGNGFAGGNKVGNSGGGGGGTATTGSNGATNGGGNGGAGLGGGGGADGLNVSAAGGAGGGSPTLFLPFPNTARPFSVSGSGGFGGSRDSNNVVLPANGTNFGGGGGGASNQNSTSVRGATGAAGVVAIVYSGQPKITIENGYTNYDSAQDITYQYITASNSNFSYIYEPVTNPTNLI
jgi:hypothetical protein